MKVVVVEPGRLAKICDIDGSLESMQGIVGGLIEVCWPFGGDHCCIVCNEEGKFDGSLPNRVIRCPDGEVEDVIFGTFFVVRGDLEDFASLSDDDAREYLEKFKLPEIIYVKKDRTITSTKYYPVE